MAQTTPNFGFNIAEGTDTVNLLTQCYPNFTSLDSILQGIKESGVTTAVATKTGTNFAVVRTDTDCNFFRFIATANYAAGDTFTVDGVAVTATGPAGTALADGAFVINQSVIAVLNASVLTVFAGGGAANASGVNYNNAGSGLTATNVQDAIDEVLSNVTDINNKYGKYVSGTILAGNTSITLADASITTSSFIDIYFKDAVLSPTAVTVSAGFVTIDIEALANNQDIAVRITNL